MQNLQNKSSFSIEESQPTGGFLAAKRLLSRFVQERF
jgi:hypothetical protein